MRRTLRSFNESLRRPDDGLDEIVGDAREVVSAAFDGEGRDHLAVKLQTDRDLNVGARDCIPAVGDEGVGHVVHLDIDQPRRPAPARRVVGLPQRVAEARPQPERIPAFLGLHVRAQDYWLGAGERDVTPRLFAQPSDGEAQAATGNLNLGPLDAAADVAGQGGHTISPRTGRSSAHQPPDTVLRVLVAAGERCERLMQERIKELPVRDVQADEMWGFVGMKEKTKKLQGINAEGLGDAYTFVALEKNTKLVLAWHLGRRNQRDTVLFTEKLHEATTGRFQLTTDGFAAYPDAVAYSLGVRVDFSQLVKIYKANRDGIQKYSPAEIKEMVAYPRWGRPDPDRICTSHVERANLSMRMNMRRLTRLTNAFSRKWENLKAALALYFFDYNFRRIHRSIRCTPDTEYADEPAEQKHCQLLLIAYLCLLHIYCPSMDNLNRITHHLIDVASDSQLCYL